MPLRSAAETRALWGWSILLVLAELSSFRIFLPHMGLYVDDWAVIRMMLAWPDQSLRGLMAALGHTPFYYLRPGDIVYFPLLYWWAGLSGWKYNAALAAMESAAALGLFLALARATRRPTLAGWAALLFLLYPSHEATHHWYNAGWPPAMMLFSAALYFHLRWSESGSRWALAASLSSLAAGDLIYEAVLPLAVLFPWLDWLRSQAEREPGRAGARALARCVPALLVVAALFAYNVAVQRLYPGTISRRIVLDGAFAARVLGRGLECSSTGLLDLLRRSLRWAAADWSPLLWLALPLTTLPWAYWSARQPMAPARFRGRAWIAGCAVAFLAAYLPYAISADRYVPHLFDVQNRVNAPASLPAALLLAFGLLRLRRPLRLAALAALLLAFTAIHWQTDHDWRKSWELQRRVLSDIEGQSARLPSDSVVYLEGAPPVLGTAPLFSDWVFDTALQDSLRRTDIHGDLWGKPPAAALPRGAHFVYHFSTRLLTPAE